MKFQPHLNIKVGELHLNGIFRYILTLFNDKVCIDDRKCRGGVLHCVYCSRGNV